MTDICLLLEGTYPYKTGGVSAWVDTLVTGLPELSFTVAHLFYGEEPLQARYRQPANMLGTTAISLNASPGSSPLTIELERLLGQVPQARVYHALSTGFAGYLGTALKRTRSAPLIVTEHGLYWREAELGIGELECGFKIVATESGALHLGTTWNSWSDTFRSLALDAYGAADAITTVCDYNRGQQIMLGADGGKIRVIPNGTHISADRPTRTLGAATIPHIALVGRVAPLKDIRTFIHACALVQRQIPGLRMSVIGPTDHDRKYFKECQAFASSLALTNFTFTGEAVMDEWYESIDAVVLTSASEAQPLALLEAMAHAIPIIATDVGGVAEIVTPYGAVPGGLLCPPSDPAACAAAIVRLLSDSALYRSCSEGGRRIVEQCHDKTAMTDAYRTVYSQFLTN
jgi:glycosyltransferase involved in cell wall biosynthesis